MWRSHESPELRSNRTGRPSQSWTNISWMIILVNIVPARHKWGVRLLQSLHVYQLSQQSQTPTPPPLSPWPGRRQGGGDTFYIRKLMNHGDSVKSRLYFVSFAFIEIQRISFKILLLNSILFVCSCEAKYRNLHSLEYGIQEVGTERPATQLPLG